MEELSPEAHQRIYRAVCYLAHADEDLQLGERAFLEGLRIKLGLGPEVAAVLEEEGRLGEGIELTPNSDEATYAIRALALVMLSDDVLHPAEAERLKRIAERVGVDQEHLTKLLRLMMVRRNQRRSRGEGQA